MQYEIKWLRFSLLVIVAAFLVSGCSHLIYEDFTHHSGTYKASQAMIAEYKGEVAKIEAINQQPISDLDKLKQRCEAYEKASGYNPHARNANDGKFLPRYSTDTSFIVGLLKKDAKMVCADYQEAQKIADREQRSKEIEEFNRRKREADQKKRTEQADKRREEEAKRAAYEATPEFALKSFCEAHCFVLQYKGFIAYQRKITSASGVIDKRAMYELGEGLVNWTETRDEWKIEYRNRTGKTPNASQCVCND